MILYFILNSLFNLQFIKYHNNRMLGEVNLKLMSL